MEREATGPGVLLELRHRFDSARELAQSFCGTVSPGPGSRLTASSDGCHSGNEREKNNKDCRQRQAPKKPGEKEEVVAMAEREGKRASEDSTLWEKKR